MRRGSKDEHEEALSAITTVHALCAWLHARHAQWCSEHHAPLFASGVLLTAGPAAGKTAALQTIAMLTAQRTLKGHGPCLVPILVRVDALAQRLLRDASRFALAWNWVDEYARIECGGEESETYLMLRQVPPPTSCTLITCE